ncbi:hypothetical protein GALMADRAFT_148224 [Galerina marginata CBS 339.88]|uniref:F-box domain-containing protein n=1 Tax=Galerina marginata (strain CBS 339.88) TaxID=685588 RepID=A0A067SH39_GALM3|nr:hypothetical protein GALMADRAFT_148224 [Galerina marginata CBS 339.88]
MESLNTTQNQRLGSESPSQTQSQIKSLHFDILREIFLFNANIFTEKNCLETTRLSSQVCHSWRSLILNSPSIWGRLFELSALEQSTERWGKEVLSRSENSLLWVYGSVSGCITHNQPGTKLFYHILAAHWERIQHLSITITDLPIDEQLWQPLLKPAPYLQSLIVHPSNLRQGYLFLTSSSSTPAALLFSNQAPMLRKFSTQCVAFSLTSTWLSHLRHLRLSLFVSVSEILNSLRSIPCLHTLTISATGERTLVSTSLPSVFLANLTTLALSNFCLPDVTEFLTHILPSDGCSLILVSHFSSHVNEDLQALSRPLSGWFKNYLRSHHVTALTMELYSTSLLFYDHTSHTDIHSVFRMAITTPGLEPLPLDSYGLIPPLFSTYDFSIVTHLELNFKNIPQATLAAFFPLFSSFPSVTDLSTDEQTISTILSTPTPTENADAAENTSLFFPLLQTLRMPSFRQTYGVRKHHLRPLLRFLRMHSALGAPIQTLDISESYSLSIDIRFLEEITGLVVMWSIKNKRFSYTCGSGQADSQSLRR